MRRYLLLAALPLILTACDGGGDPVAQAVREVSAQNHARAVQDGQVSGPATDGTADPDTSASSTARLFAGTEADIGRQLAKATGQTADEAYIAKMIALHEGAVAMARTALTHAQDPQVRQWAQQTIEEREDEIALLRAWKPAN